jgi:hypothetical protein
MHFPEDIIYRFFSRRPFNYTRVHDRVLLGRMPRSERDIDMLIQVCERWASVLTGEMGLERDLYVGVIVVGVVCCCLLLLFTKAFSLCKAQSRAHAWQTTHCLLFACMRGALSWTQCPEGSCPCDTCLQDSGWLFHTTQTSAHSLAPCQVEHVTAFVVMSELWELPYSLDVYKQRSVPVLHIPVPDYSAPTPAELQQAVAYVRQHLDKCVRACVRACMHAYLWSLVCVCVCVCVCV